MAIFIIIDAVVVLVVVYALLLAPAAFPKNGDAILWRTFYAHRGLHNKNRTVPENSLAAFSAAVTAGYGIELDVNITADGQVVVFHDSDLKRMCGVDKAVNDCTYEELRRCKLLDTNEGIPLFSEVLELVKGEAALIVELKSSRRNTELCEKTAALLDDYKGPYCIESFDPRIVRWFAKNRRQVVRGQLSAGLKNYSDLPFYQAVMLSGLLTNVVTRPHFVAFRHQDSPNVRLGIFRLLGGKLAGWTVRDTDDIQRLRKYFDVIIFEFFKP